MLTLQSDDGDVLLPVAVQPRASRNVIAGLHQSALKILLTAPPVEGTANTACLRFLAEQLGVSPARLSIARGTKSRQKLIRISGVSADSVRARLQTLNPQLDL